jgi:glycine/D-amino acid oxidase-like deaminating enzyme
LALAENGTDVVVLEARAVGHGGSGRNGGQVIPGLKQDPYELLAELDRAVAKRIIELVAAFPGAEAIYERNIETLRRLGAVGWRKLMSNSGCTTDG